MNHARTLLLSTALLATACTKETKAAPNTPPATPPAAGQPQPAAPNAGAPVVNKAPEAAAAPSVADLGKVLAGIKDGPTAEAAKAPLAAIVQQLEAAKKAAPAAAGTEALSGLGKLAGDAAAKLGVSAETTKQITALLDNPSVKAVIGPTLEKLQGLLK